VQHLAEIALGFCLRGGNAAGIGMSCYLCLELGRERQ
jgi:hypothetical protein